MEIQPTKMSQGEDDYDEEALQRFTVTIAAKINEGAQKIESFSSSACINRVPVELRKLKESAYIPRLVAIGPLHRNDQHLQTHMHHVKLSYTNYLLSRLAGRLAGGMEEQLELAKPIKLKALQECFVEMKKSIDAAKKCYAEEVMLDEEMLLVDGCFILEFLYRYHTFEGQEKETDVIFGNSSTFRDVRNDLVLLENQIPFFVLKKLFQLTVDRIPNRYHKCSLTDYVGFCYHEWMSPVRNSYMHIFPLRDYVLRVFGSTTAAEEKVQSENIDDHRTTANDYYHILHNLHDCYFPRDKKKQKKPSKEILMPSASELFYAGVKFVPGMANNQFNVKFIDSRGLFWWCSSARFEIPQLVIRNHTESLFTNLIAFEQSCPGVSKHVSSYAILMGMLVNTDTDARLLEKAGVVRNYLGPTEDTTHLFKNLSKETFGTESVFADACSKATEYSNRFWPTNMAYWRREYFANPWQFIALWVSFMAFSVSFLQFCTDFAKNGGRG